jgi:hypothetical protein
MKGLPKSAGRRTGPPPEGTGEDRRISIAELVADLRGLPSGIPQEVDRQIVAKVFEQLGVGDALVPEAALKCPD